MGQRGARLQVCLLPLVAVKGVVLVIGAGIVGLSMAIMLAHQG